MISGLVLAFEQIGDPRVRSIILRAVLIGMAVFIGLMLLINWLLAGQSVVGIGWMDAVIRFLGGSAAFVLGLLFFPAFAGLVLSLNLEPIARAVEARHYPNLPPPREEPVVEIIINALRFTGVTITLNLLILLILVPVLIVPILTIPLIPFVFYFLNGYLLGREHFEFAAARRLSPGPMRALRKQHRARILGCGVAISVLMTIPVVNLLMPVVAAAYMIHVFEGVRPDTERA